MSAKRIHQDPRKSIVKLRMVADTMVLSVPKKMMVDMGWVAGEYVHLEAKDSVLIVERIKEGSIPLLINRQ